jgi:hypothetical protein
MASLSHRPGSASPAAMRAKPSLDVAFQRFLKPVKISAVAAQISPLLPLRYSPIQPNGHGYIANFRSLNPGTATLPRPPRKADEAVSIVPHHSWREPEKAPARSGTHPGSGLFEFRDIAHGLQWMGMRSDSFRRQEGTGNHRLSRLRPLSSTPQWVFG